MKSGFLAGIVIVAIIVVLGMAQALDSYWQGKAEYELAAAAAAAVRADTQAAHGLDMRGVLYGVGTIITVVVLVGMFLGVQAAQQRRLMEMLVQHDPTPIHTELAPTCLPNDVGVLLEAPERENTYISVWAGNSAGEK